MNIGSVHAWILFAALSACQRNTPPRATTASPGDSPAADERGMAVEVRPFTLEVTPRLRGSRDIVLKSGDMVVSRDRIKVEVKTSADAHVYLGYCDKYFRLTIFPREGSIEAKAGETTYAPHKDAELKLDDQLGSEVLYVIASRRKLDLADPDLAEAISKAGADSQIGECTPLKRALAKRKAPDPVKPGPPPRRAHKTPEPEPSGPERRFADLERGSYINWEATGGVSAGGDRDGIVVLRYTFTHVSKLTSL